MCIYIERYNYISLYAYVQSRDVFCVYILVLNCCCTGCVPLVKGKIEINQQHMKSKRAVHIRSRKHCRRRVLCSAGFGFPALHLSRQVLKSHLMCTSAHRYKTKV